MGRALVNKQQAGGVTKTTPKAPSKKGAFIDVQNRTIAGSKMTKAKSGMKMSKMSKKKSC